MCQIHNDIFRLSVSTTGAELDELCIHDINILWKKNKIWNAQSPLLFPIVGCLKDNYYIYKDNRYSLPCHGFLKNQPFQIVKKTDSMVEFITYSTEETLKNYPFPYALKVTYELLDYHIHISFELTNLGIEDMRFGFGFHPGFAYDGLEKVLGKDIKVLFQDKEAISVEFNPSFVTEMRRDNLEEIRNLKDISKKLMDKRTLCYQDINDVELYSSLGVLQIKQDMKYMAFWQSEPENPKFLCIEAWDGLPDEEHTNHQWSDKWYMQTLKSKECYKKNIVISFIDKGAQNENN